MGPLPGRLAGEPAAHRQQRLPPARAPLRLEDAAQGREDASARVLAALRRGTGIGVLRLTPARGGGDGVTLAPRRARRVSRASLVRGSSRAVRPSTLARLRRTAAAKPCPGFAPPVSIVKPLSRPRRGSRGEPGVLLPPRLSRRTRSSSPSPSGTDPAYAVARRVADRHPDVRDRRSSSTGASRAGTPRSTASPPACAAPGIGTSCSPTETSACVRISSRRAVSLFADPRVGLVSHLFRGRGRVEPRLADRVPPPERLPACRARPSSRGVLRRPCVVGKSILVSRDGPRRDRGLRAAARLPRRGLPPGRQVRRAGYRVVLSADEIDTAEVQQDRCGPSGRATGAGRCCGARLGGIALPRPSSSRAPLPWFAVAGLRARAAHRRLVRGGRCFWPRDPALESRLARPSGPAAPGRGRRCSCPCETSAWRRVFWAGLVGRRTRGGGERSTSAGTLGSVE